MFDPSEREAAGAGWIDPASYPELTQLTTRWHVIREELSAVLNAGRPWMRFTDDDSVASLESSSQAEVAEIIGRKLVPLDNPCPHKLYPLMRERKVFSLTADLCPETVATLSALPASFNAAFAALEPNGSIAPHQGSSDRVDRCHLGLKIPAGDTKLKVSARARGWEEGGLLVFDDRSWHEAWNNTGERRFVLIVDLEKAMARDRKPMKEEMFGI